MDRWHHEHLDKMQIQCEFAHELFLEDIAYMSPKLLLIFSFINNYCADRNINFKVTSMIRSSEYDSQLGAVSKTHQEGRAFDFSIENFSYQEIQELIDEVNSRFSNIAATSAATGLPRPIVVHRNHDGKGNHAHVQVKR